jgi:hypothetical protein
MEDVLKEVFIQPPMQLDTAYTQILLSFQTILLIRRLDCQLQLDLSLVTKLLVMLEFQALINVNLWETQPINVYVLKLLALPVLAKTISVNLLDNLQDGLNFLQIVEFLAFRTVTLETCVSTNIATLPGLILIQ